MIEAEYNRPKTTLWSFPERGQWATHNARYPGNCAPQVIRTIIETYSKPGDLLLDPMAGSGTSLIEARCTARNAIGVDINPDACELCKKNIAFDCQEKTTQKILNGDARNLSNFDSESVDLIFIHPPYWNIIKYSNPPIENDISNCSSMEGFLYAMQMIGKELFRVLKPNRYCAMLIGDTRRCKHYIPLAYLTMNQFLNAGFALREDIIKAQHNCSSNKKWNNPNRKLDFFLIMHEHLFVFRKPARNENLNSIKYSINVN